VIAEPVFSGAENPEAVLQRAVVTAVHSILRDAGREYVLIERYGLDVSVFLPHAFRQLELKAYNGTRISFGDGKGKGPQIDLLWDGDTNECRPMNELEILDASVRWILMDCLKRPHRFTMFTCAQAQKAASGGQKAASGLGVSSGKQNNFRLGAFEGQWLSWSELLDGIRNFLIGADVPPHPDPLPVGERESPA
jgi:hypothetical protein